METDLISQITIDSSNAQNPGADKRNWTEDFKHENGCYTGLCVYCKLYFLGYKRRVVCKECDTKNRFFPPVVDTDKINKEVEEIFSSSTTCASETKPVPTAGMGRYYKEAILNNIGTLTISESTESITYTYTVKSGGPEGNREQRRHPKPAKPKPYYSQFNSKISR